MKVGVDLVLNKRFERHLGDEKFLERVFHSSELKNKSKLIGIFALKEATMKALGRKIDWKEIEIKSKEKPEIKLSDSVKPEGFKSICGSISHDGDYTIGMVGIEE